MKQHAVKGEKKKDDGRWFLIIMLIGLLFVIVLELSGQGKDPQLIHLEELCQDLCQEKGLQMSSIGFREPCGAPMYEACLLCLCHRTDDPAKQSIFYDYATGNKTYSYGVKT